MVTVSVIGGVLLILALVWGLRKFTRWLSSGDVAKVELKHAQEKEAEAALSKALKTGADSELARALDDFGVRPPFPRGKSKP